MYYRCPIVVNNYSTFEVDIKPRGFRVIEFDGYITEATVAQTPSSSSTTENRIEPLPFRA